MPRIIYTIINEHPTILTVGSNNEIPRIICTIINEQPTVLTMGSNNEMPRIICAIINEHPTVKTVGYKICLISCLVGSSLFYFFSKTDTTEVVMLGFGFTATIFLIKDVAASLRNSCEKHIFANLVYSNAI